jgi:hypothetical protein
MYRPSKQDLPKSGTIEYAFVKSSTATCFKFFDLSFEYCVGVQNFKTLNTKVLKMRKPPYFPSNRSPKHVGPIHFLFGGQFGVSQAG